jgi:uncharacterized protein YggT (Ycf19 family)
MGRALLTVLIFLLQVYWWAIFASAILSWGFLSPSNKLVRILRFITEPIVNPCRLLLYRILPFAWRRFDFSPVLAILLVNIISSILTMVLNSLPPV